MHLKLKSWAVCPFELIYHAEIHYRKGEGYDKRLALISFDNSIEVSISTYLKLKPEQRGGREYENRKVEGWLKNYNTKLDFFEEEIKRRQLLEFKPKQDIIWYHNQRNKVYHDYDSFAPDPTLLNDIRGVALWVFSVLFDFNCAKVEGILEETIKDSEPSIPDSFTIVPQEPNADEFKFDTNSTNVLAVASLIGQWDEGNNDDLIIIGKFTDNSNTWLSGIQEVLQKNKSPVTLYNGKWKIPDRQSLWDTLASSIFDSHLDTIASCSVDVLTKIDPQLLPDEHFATPIHDKVTRCSENLRQGLAETLALLANRGDKLIHCSRNKVKNIAAISVYKIFEQADWKLWGSLNNLLPVLAEASPKQFLDAIETALLKEPCPLDQLFSQKNRGIFGFNYMTGLLWGLESLAWHKDYLVRVALVLADLATHDPGGNQANRPVNSLITILLPWFPQTLATIKKRLACITAIKVDFPDIAWEVVINLLPDQHQTSSGTYKPRWRQPLPEDWKPKVLKGDYWKQIDGYAEVVIELSLQDMNKFKDLMKLLDNLPQASFDKVLQHLSTNEIKSMPEPERLPIWEALTGFISKHRFFFDAEWAWPEAKVFQIEKVANDLSPSSHEERGRRLFSKKQDFELYEERLDLENQEKILEKKRYKIVEAMFQEGGVKRVLAFSRTVKESKQVGKALGKIAKNQLDLELLPQFLISGEQYYDDLVAGFIESRFYRRDQGWSWVDSLDISRWSMAKICQFLTFLPFEKETWVRANKWLSDSESDYWNNVTVNPPQSAANDLYLAIDKLLEVGRAYFVIECFFWVIKKEIQLDTLKAVRALLMVASEQVTRGGMDIFTIELIKALQNSDDIKKDDLCKVEWAYCPLLDESQNIQPVCLERKLSTDPKFFCEVIRIIHCSKNLKINQHEHDEQREKNYRCARHLLYKWKIPPGLQKDGSFASDDFINWLNQVKEECSQKGHSEEAIRQVGEVLFYAPDDIPELWINKTVAKVLNDKTSNDMREGYQTRAYNSRGVYRLDPTGQPERQLADTWRQKADALENKGFARFATTIRGLAESYDQEAEHIVADFRHR